MVLASDRILKGSQPGDLPIVRPAETTARIGRPASPKFQLDLGAVELGMALAAELLAHDRVKVPGHER